MGEEGENGEEGRWPRIWSRLVGKGAIGVCRAGAAGTLAGGEAWMKEGGSRIAAGCTIVVGWEIVVRWVMLVCWAGGADWGTGAGRGAATLVDGVGVGEACAADCGRAAGG